MNVIPAQKTIDFDLKTFGIAGERNRGGETSGNPSKRERQKNSSSSAPELAIADSHPVSQEGVSGQIIDSERVLNLLAKIPQCSETVAESIFRNRRTHQTAEPLSKGINKTY